MSDDVIETTGTEVRPGRQPRARRPNLSAFGAPRRTVEPPNPHALTRAVPPPPPVPKKSEEFRQFRTEVEDGIHGAMDVGERFISALEAEQERPPAANALEEEAEGFMAAWRVIGRTFFGT